MNLKSLTENRYTLNDIFVKNSEGWLAVALLMYPLAHLIHIVYFSFTCEFYKLSLEQFAHFLMTKEFPGDYFVEIIEAFATFAIIIGLIGIISKTVFNAKNKTLIDSDSIPSFFFVAFIALAVISVAVNGITFDYFIGYTERGEGFIAILFYFFVFFAGSMIKKEKIKYIVIYFIMGLGLVNGVMTLVNEWAWEVPIANHPPYCSVYYNVNFYAYFLTILIMLSASLVLKEKSTGRKIFAFAMLCMNTAILAMNNTFGCFVACFVAFIFMIVADSLQRKKFSFAALGLFGVFLGISFVMSFWYRSFFTQILGMFGDMRLILLNAENADDAGTLRWGLWRHTFDYIREKPWLGFGFEGVCDRLLEEAGQSKVHNEYLEYAADFGVPAALIYIAGLISIYIKALVKRAKVDGATFCALVAAFGYIGSAFFGNTMIFIAPLFFIVLGLANTIPATPEAIPANSPAEATESSPEPDTAPVPEAETGEITEENPEEITEENPAESEADMQEADE